MKDTIVLYPALGSGHLISMVELGKLILTHHPSFSITILILTPPNNNSTTTTTTTTNNNNTTTQHTLSPTSQYIASVSCTIPSITFHHIPPISFTTTLPPHLLTLEISPQSNHHVHHFLQTISKTSNLKAVVLDFMNYTASKITSTLHIPTYFYYTSGVSTLATMLHFPTFHQNATKPIKDLDMPLQNPGLPRISTDDYPEETKDPKSHVYHVLLDTAKTMRDCVGIIVNTFDAIEGSVVRALGEGLYVPDGTTPPVFCIGPVISASYGEDENGCLTWLDSQPSQSVVLLSFGSMGRFSRARLKEIAFGLEKSEQRFMWVVRSESDSEEELSLNELLPEGFLERTKGKGMVVRNWAPQAAILSHDSVGGFVTHCGWNSVLEAVCEGVPMVAWPLYAEQRMNRVILVEEMKVALAVNKSEDGFVSANELGERVKELMESERGEEIRERIGKMKMGAKEARASGGSSLVALKRLTESWREHSSQILSPNSPFQFSGKERKSNPRN